MIDLFKIVIDKAIDNDSSILTEISFAAKRHWNYPDNYYDIWKDELTITKDYIRQNIVYKAQLGDLTLGFYSIVENKSDIYSGETLVKKGFYLEHIFIRPEYHKFGIGRLMIDHAKKISKNTGINNMLIFVDPYAKGFYDKIGADYLYDSKSSIPGRLIPVYDLKV
ncbi:MAG: GNAT family N-acetyltransferase [Bacteroidales bacterium]